MTVGPDADPPSNGPRDHRADQCAEPTEAEDQTDRTRAQPEDVDHEEDVDRQEHVAEETTSWPRLA